MHMTSKYEDGIFSNMKNCVLLTIIFTNFIHCCDVNISDVSLPNCPYKLFRRKREQPEYTRWRASLHSTPEFIVKVLDDDFTTPIAKKIIAINIQPFKKSDEKIIIGGAMIPKPTTTSTVGSTTTSDYTRFVPPTTVTHVDGGHYIAAPIQLPSLDINNVVPPRQPPGKHPQRDESPPSGPQFVPRVSPAAWQFAPITPVGFSRRKAVVQSPVTPAPEDLLPRHSASSPSRTSTLAAVFIPTRIKSDYDELRRYHQQEFNEPYHVRTSALQQDPHGALSESYTTPSTDNEITDKRIYSDDTDGDKKIEHSDGDATYHMMFYNDEEDKNKKSDQSSDEAYDDKIKDREVNENKSIVMSLSEKVSLRTNVQNTMIEHSDPVKKETISISSTTEVVSSSNKRVTMISRAILMSGNGPRNCSLLKMRRLSFKSPRTLNEIEYQLKKWDEKSPLAKYIDITGGNLTTMENSIHMIVVDDPSSGQIVSAKQTVMIVAGIQGRDHHAVTAAMYVLYQLIERSEVHSDLLAKYRFWIIPVFNPDGYDYSMTFPHRREWTKNLRQSWDVCNGRDVCKACDAFGLRCTIQPCYGVNLDRNFEYQWIPADELRLEHPCGTLYAGSRQLSEAETRALTRYLHAKHELINTFIAFKEGEVLGVMYPFSHTKKRRSFDNVYRQRASRAAAAAYSISGRPYVAGQTSEFLPLYAGGIEDWVDSHLGIDNIYTIVMFRPTDTFSSKLLTERVVHEAYAAMDTLVLQTSDEVIATPTFRLRAVSTANALLIPSVVALSTAILAFVIVNF